MKKITKLTLTLLIINFSFSIVFAQVGINNDNSEPDASAMLDVKSDSKGMLVPRMSSSQRTQISNAATGLLVFDTNTESFWFKDSNIWIELVSGNVTALSDADNDTRIQVEEGNDDDKIRFDIGSGLGSAESFLMERRKLTIKDDPLTVGILSIVMDNNNTGINEIRSILPNNAFFPTDNKLQFFVNGIKPLELLGNGDITINGNYTLPSNDGTANQTLTTDGNGNVDWVDAATQNIIEDTDGDTRVRVEGGTDDDIIRFNMNGTEYMRLDSGRIAILNTMGNVMLGAEAGSKLNYQSAFNNTFVGNRAGEKNTTGGLNTAIGSFALGENTTGASNVALGYATLNQNTDGTENTAVGMQALQDGNGINNTVLGYQAGNNFLGSNSLFLGHQAGFNASGDNKLYIANSNTATPLIYGEFDNDLVRINGDLEVTGTFPTTTATIIEDTDSDTKIQVEESADEDVIRLDVAETEAMHIESDFSSSSSINANTIPSFTSLTTFNNGQADWQSFTATATAKLDSLRMNMDQGEFTGVSIYNFNIYKGEGTSGTLLTSTSAAAPMDGLLFSSQFVRIPVTDEVVLEKDSIYTISFDNRSGIGYKSGNLYADGRSGFNIDQDYVLEVYAFTASPNTTINGTLNVTGSDATVTADAFIGDGSALTNLPNQVPIGTIIMWPSETLPAGWIPCNGQPFVRNDYPELFDILGDTGDGTANVPNFRGRFPLGIGDSQTPNSTDHAIKSTGGLEKYALTVNEIPAHSHGAGSLTTQFPYKTRTNTGAQNNKDGSDENFFDSSAITGSTANTGGGQAHENMPPFYTINFIIKAE